MMAMTTGMQRDREKTKVDPVKTKASVVRAEKMVKKMHKVHTTGMRREENIKERLSVPPQKAPRAQSGNPKRPQGGNLFGLQIQGTAASVPVQHVVAMKLVGGVTGHLPA